MIPLESTRFGSTIYFWNLFDPDPGSSDWISDPITEPNLTESSMSYGNYMLKMKIDQENTLSMDAAVWIPFLDFIVDLFVFPSDSGYCIF